MERSGLFEVVCVARYLAHRDNTVETRVRGSGSVKDCVEFMPKPYNGITYPPGTFGFAYRSPTKKERGREGEHGEEGEDRSDGDMLVEKYLPGQALPGTWYAASFVFLLVLLGGGRDKGYRLLT